MDLGVTVLAGLGGRHLHDLAGARLDKKTELAVDRTGKKHFINLGCLFCSEAIELLAVILTAVVTF